MTQRTFTFTFDDGAVVDGVTWDGVCDDNNFFETDVVAMDKMAVGETRDCDFVVVTRTR